MCLLNVDEKPARKFGIGYKGVKREKRGYVCCSHPQYLGTVTYPLNQWITDPNDGEAMGFSGVPAGYRTGFHISLDKWVMGKRSRGQYAVIKVRFRKVTATGCAVPNDTWGRQVVAREIMNLGEV